MSRRNSAAGWYLDRPARRSRRTRRRPPSDSAKPAYALGALFLFYFVLGTVIANWQVALAVGLVLAVLIWLVAVVLEALDVPDTWRLRRARRALRREAESREALSDV